MAELAARIVAMFGRGTSSAAIFLFGYLCWYLLRGPACTLGPSAICEAGVRLVSVLNSANGLIAPVVLILSIIGIGYLVSFAHDLLFDETLRGNYDPLISIPRLRSRMDVSLQEMRAASNDELGAIAAKTGRKSLTDFLLYEIVGGITKTSTRQYVDEARVYGAVTITIIVFMWVDRLVFGPLSVSTIVVLSALSALVYGLGRECVKAQYKYRAIRIYSNYLAKVHA